MYFPGETARASLKRARLDHTVNNCSDFPGETAAQVRLNFSPSWQGRFDQAGDFRSFRRRVFGVVTGDPGDVERRPHEAWGSYFATHREARDVLRRLSRYPQGVSEDVLARLEETYGQIEAFPPGGEP